MPIFQQIMIVPHRAVFVRGITPPPGIFLCFFKSLHFDCSAINERGAETHECSKLPPAREVFPEFSVSGIWNSPCSAPAS